jgi:Ca2+-transporting ATPase
MRRPPRAKNAPVLTTRLLYRILFSASMIVLGTLFIYGEELSDGETAQRDQTMVSLRRARAYQQVLRKPTDARCSRPSRPSCSWIWSLLSRIAV